MIQVSGSGIESSDDWQGSLVTIDVDVLLVDFGAQLVIIVFFLIVVGIFDDLTEVENVISEAGKGWGKFLRAVCYLITVSYVEFEWDYGIGLNGADLR